MVNLCEFMCACSREAGNVTLFALLFGPSSRDRERVFFGFLPGVVGGAKLGLDVLGRLGERF